MTLTPTRSSPSAIGVASCATARAMANTGTGRTLDELLDRHQRAERHTGRRRQRPRLGRAVDHRERPRAFGERLGIGDRELDSAQLVGAASHQRVERRTHFRQIVDHDRHIVRHLIADDPLRLGVSLPIGRVLRLHRKVRGLHPVLRNSRHPQRREYAVHRRRVCRERCRRRLSLGDDARRQPRLIRLGSHLGIAADRDRARGHHGLRSLRARERNAGHQRNRAGQCGAFHSCPQGDTRHRHLTNSQCS